MTPEEKIAFVQRIAPWAQFAQAKYGVPASVTIAQAILESSDGKGNWGRSFLAANYNNFFGIKHNSHLDDGFYCELRTSEHIGQSDVQLQAQFAAFEDPQRSFEAHGRLLANSPRYRPAMAESGDPLEFAALLGPTGNGGCGYSTNPEYGKILVKLITDFHLRDYDVKASADAKA